MRPINVQPITYDPRACFVPGHGIEPSEVEQLAPWLLAARSATLDDVSLLESGKNVIEHKRPLDAGFINLPQRLLDEYDQKHQQSELGRILATAHRLQEEVDRIVVLGIGGSYMGAKALFESCGAPYHNELDRGRRGGRPRIYFEGNNVDNDASQGLLDLLGRGRPASTIDDRWGIVVISKSGGTLETAVAFRQFLATLGQSVGGDQAKLAKLVVPVTALNDKSKLFRVSKTLGCPDVFDIPDGIGGRFSIFTAVGLLPAAILGLNVVELLQGAAAMTERFKNAPPGENPVLDYVAVCHLLEQKQNVDIRVLSAWSKGLESAGLWYDQLLSESLGKNERGATPLTSVTTRDLHSRGQQHQEGKRNKLITNLIVDKPKHDRLAVGRHSEALNGDDLNWLADATLPDIMSAAIAGTNEAYRADRRPTADFHLPRLDEATMGQLFQLLMLATVVEGRLVNINPYGQPGVEAYKTNMMTLLKKQFAK